MSNVFRIGNIGDVGITENIEENIVQYFDWNFANIGACVNVRIPQSGLYGNLHVLREVNDERYAQGRIWESVHNNWSYDESITNSINFSGVFVNSVFYPTSGLAIDYAAGQVTFPTPVSGNVQCEYSYKEITVISSDRTGFLQDDWDKLDINQFSTGSGNYLYPSETRIQTPTVIIEVPSIDSLTPYALGSPEKRIDFDIGVYVVTDNKSQGRRIADAVSSCFGKTLLLFDLNKVNASGVYYLDYNGDKNPNGLPYPDLLNDAFGFGKLYIKKVAPNFKTSVDNQLYVRSISLMSEIILPY